MERSTILRKLMNDRNLKVSDISKTSGIAYSTIKSILENGTEKASYINICKICSALGITPDELEGMAKGDLIVPAPISANDSSLLEKYHSLDPYGQETVNYILDRESSRVTALRQKDQRITELEARPAAIIDFQERSDQASRIAEYFRSASAGGGVFILGNEATSKILVSESDWDDRVDYVISVSGHSMEPDYNDGDKVMVSQRLEMQHGDVGIFVINGKAYIKEYGEKELISRNPDSDNIKISEYDNIVCMGKVIGKLKGKYEIIDD